MCSKKDQGCSVYGQVPGLDSHLSLFKQRWRWKHNNNKMVLWLHQQQHKDPIINFRNKFDFLKDSWQEVGNYIKHWLVFSIIFKKTVIHEGASEEQWWSNCLRWKGNRVKKLKSTSNLVSTLERVELIKNVENILVTYRMRWYK